MVYAPASGKTPAKTDDGDSEGGGRAARVLDVSAVVAGVVLVVIALDIVTKGKITGWMLRRKDPPSGSTTPCGCQDAADAVAEEVPAGDG